MSSLNPDKALAELCRRSFFRFVKEFWSVIIPEEPVYNWHIEYLCDELQYLNSFVVARKPKPYDLLINIPPATTKSTIVLQMYNAWVWTTDPSQRLISSSYSSSLSLSHAVRTRDIVTSDKYKKLFPEVALKDDQQSKSDFRNTSGGQRFTTSTGGTVTGMHGHQILIDDPINPQQAASEADREAADTHVNTTLATRKIDRAVTPTILVMQRLHEKDPSGIWLSKKTKNIKHICLPATVSGKVKPLQLINSYKLGMLDPVRLNLTALNEAKDDLGAYQYSGQYDQDPTPREGGIFKRDDFQIIPWKAEYSYLTWHFVIDSAYTEKEINDPSGFLAYAEYNNEWIIRDARLERLEFPDLCRAVVSFVQYNAYNQRSIIKVEPKASGKSLVQTLKRETKLNIKEDSTPDRDKVARANDASTIVEAKRVKLIDGAWNKQFIDQVTTFPKATHDEYVDCLVMMLGLANRNKGRKLKRGN